MISVGANSGLLKIGGALYPKVPLIPNPLLLSISINKVTFKNAYITVLFQSLVFSKVVGH